MRLTDLDLESVVEQVLDRGWCTMPTIHAIGRRLIHLATRFGLLAWWWRRDSRG
ncbi:MAG: hypothetical protein R2713_02350 [Ilumatobacteraceae bacterium]